MDPTMIATAAMYALNIAATVVPMITSSSQVANVITELKTLTPIVAQAIPQAIGQIKSMIDSLRGNAATTPAQLAELDAVEAQLDADYDAASAAAKAEDDAADAAAKPTT